MPSIIHKIAVVRKGLVDWARARVSAAAEGIREGGMSLTQAWPSPEHEQYVRDLLRVGIVVLVGGACYGLGLIHGRMPVAGIRLDTSSRAQNSTALVPSAAQAVPLQNAAPHGATIVASKNGTKYHYLWCPGAARIAPKNRRYFTTVAEAERAGYTRASTCKQ